VTLLLVQAVILTFGTSFALHTHAYTDHDHPEHHHGLAAHHHHDDVASSRPARGTVRLDACDPAQHLVSFGFACPPPPDLHTSNAELGAAAPFGPWLQAGAAVAAPDIRVHGPPSRAHASPRAPPLKFLA
jgi:hypothetical protein